MYSLHPLVLIQVSDHITRIRAQIGAEQRVVGCVLGVQSSRVVEITNAFELKYTMQNGQLVIDKEFLLMKQDQCPCRKFVALAMTTVCSFPLPDAAHRLLLADKKVFPKFEVVGWYSSGSGLAEGDLTIHKGVREHPSAVQHQPPLQPAASPSLPAHLCR